MMKNVYKCMLLLVFIAMHTTACTMQSKQEKEVEFLEKRFYGVHDLKKQETEFENSPSPKKAFDLMEKYKNVRIIKDYSKALYYANKCIELGADDNRFGIFTYVWMSSIYHEQNRDRLACKYLNKAFNVQEKFPDHQVINNNILLAENLEPEFVEKCK